jgi:double-stranded uracil-DNA glycosylase
LSKPGLDPVVDRKSRVLILGTLPGDESLRQQRYYSDPSNKFWTLLSDLFGEASGHTYTERLMFLANHGVALWDVLRSAERLGSSDSNISNPVPNDFHALFVNFPMLRRVGFNGTKAENLWRKHVGNQAEVAHDEIVAAVLPSSSGSPGRHVLPYEQKLARWKQFLRPS